MLEMFILNPPRKGRRVRDAPKVRIRKRRLKKRRFHRNGKGRFIKFRRKHRMAVRTRRRRRYRRNASWWRQSADHGVASKLGWIYRKHRLPSTRRRAIQKLGIGRLKKYRKRHHAARRRRRTPMSIPYKVFGRTVRLVANRRRRRRRRYADNARRRRMPARGRGGRFVSRRRRSRRRRYAANWFVTNPRRRRRRRRHYADNRRRRRSRRRYAANWFVTNPRRRRRRYRRNWFVYNDNPRRRRRSRRRRYADNRRRRHASRKRYMDNVGEGILESVTSVFDMEFLTGTALPVLGGFFGSRLISGVVGGAVVGANYTGVVRHLGNLISAGLAGAAIGFLTKDASVAGNFVLGGVVNAIAGIARDVVKDVDFVKGSPALRESFGLAGLDDMGDDIRSQVEREVMKELGVSDFLTSEQLSRAERVGDFLTSEQMGRAERIGQYPAETSGSMAQYPEETSGGAMADFADVASFGG